MKIKYRIYAHKLYSPRDVSRRIGIDVKKIIDLLEKNKTFGSKMGNFWFIRGSEILEINKILRRNKVGQNSIDRGKLKRLEKEERKDSGEKII